MISLWLKAPRGEEARQQCELSASAKLPCYFDISVDGDWRPARLREGDRLRVAFDGSSWCARLLSGDLAANGLRIIGELTLYAPMVLRLGSAHFFIDDMPDPAAQTISAAALCQQHAAAEREIADVVDSFAHRSEVD